MQAHDQYVAESAEKRRGMESDFVFVNLFRAPLGAPMTPAAVNDLLAGGLPPRGSGPRRAPACAAA